MDDATLSITREQSSLRLQVTDRLRDAILSGRFEPGQKLIERELCTSLDISRTLLREAMQHLQAEGLIRLVMHRGPSVASIGLDEAREIYKVREALEAVAAEGFARHADDAQRVALREALRALASAGRRAGGAGLLEAKNRFYAVLLDGCGNRVVAEMLRLLNNRVNLLRRRSMAQPGRLPQMLAELEAVVTAIEARDARRAGRLCAAHVRRAAAAAVRSFAAEPSGGTASPARRTR